MNAIHRFLPVWLPQLLPAQCCSFSEHWLLWVECLTSLCSKIPGAGKELLAKFQSLQVGSLQGKSSGRQKLAATCQMPTVFTHTHKKKPQFPAPQRGSGEPIFLNDMEAFRGSRMHSGFFKVWVGSTSASLSSCERRSLPYPVLGSVPV